MSVGIIIIFHNNEKNIDINIFIKQLNNAKNIEFCLVNNASKDNTYKLLNSIKESKISNVSVIDIKKFKSDESAIRAGARFMFNQFNLKHLGYVYINSLSTKKNSISGLMLVLCKNEDAFLNYTIESKKKTKTKQPLFESLFSVIDYLKINSTLILLQYQRNILKQATNKDNDNEEIIMDNKH